MQRRIFTLDGMPFVASRHDGGFFEPHATMARLIEGHGRGGVPDAGGTAKEAAAADAAIEHEIAGERGAGGGQEVRRGRTATRPRTPGRDAKRDR